MKEIKSFFKPTLAKLISGIILIIIFVALAPFYTTPACCEAPTKVGLPLPYYYHQASLISKTEYFSYTIIFIDIILWYLIACTIIHIYKNFKEK